MSAKQEWSRLGGIDMSSAMVQVCTFPHSGDGMFGEGRKVQELFVAQAGGYRHDVCNGAGEHRREGETDELCVPRVVNGAGRGRAGEHIALWKKGQRGGDIKGGYRGYRHVVRNGAGKHCPAYVRRDGWEGGEVQGLFVERAGRALICHLQWCR